MLQKFWYSSNQFEFLEKLFSIKFSDKIIFRSVIQENFRFFSKIIFQQENFVKYQILL